MQQFYAALDAAWRVLLISVVLGAGLPVLFAYGIRALAWGSGGDAGVHDADVVLKPHLIGRVIGYTLFGIVIVSVLLGISYIVAHGLGYAITFNGFLPVFTQK